MKLNRKAVKEHPDFQHNAQTGAHDICLIELSSPVPIDPVNISFSFDKHTSIFVLGVKDFGDGREYTKMFYKHMIEVPSALLSLEDCEKLKLNSEGSFYTKLDRAQTSDGDSGGLVFKRKKDGKIKAIGVLTGISIEDEKVVGVTNLGAEKHKKWISDNSDWTWT